MLLIALTLCVAPLLATPRPAEPLVTLESARGVAAHFNRLIVVERDGRWRAGSEEGRLSAAALAELQRSITFIPEEQAVPCDTCRARPFAHLRLRTAGGSWLESTPCGPRWHPAVADVAARLQRLPRAGSELVRLEEASVNSGAWQVRALVTSDGRWQGRGGHGTLAAPQLERLRAAIARASFRRVAHPLPCEAEPTVRYHLSAGGRAISWASPCGSEPEPSVVELERLLGDLTGAQ